MNKPLEMYQKMERSIDQLQASPETQGFLLNVAKHAAFREAIKHDEVMKPNQWEFDAEQELFGIRNNQGFLSLKPQKKFISDMRQLTHIHYTVWDWHSQNNKSNLESLVNGALQSKTLNQNGGRLFRTYLNGEDRIARSIHSPSYGLIDDLYLIDHTLEALAESGRLVKLAETPGINESVTHLKFIFPDMKSRANELLRKYKPVGGDIGDRSVAVGFMLGNSEVGSAAASVYPLVQVLLCTNGMVGTRSGQAFKKSHRGSKRDLGFQWSHRTREAGSKFAASQVRDRLEALASPGYLSSIIEKWGGLSEAEIVKPTATVMDIGQKFLELSEENATTVSEHFLKGQDPSAFGIIQAVTSFARDESLSPEKRFDLQGKAWDMTFNHDWLKKSYIA